MEHILKNKNLKYIFLMIIFLSISIGLWNNFRLLWLEENGLTAEEIGKIMSFASFFGCLSILFISLKVDMNQIKNMVSWTLIIKILSQIILFFGYHYLPLKLIAILFIFDIASYAVGFLGIYPLITRIEKSEDIYSYRKLTQYIFQDIGVLIGGLFIGFSIGSFVVSYNSFLFISICSLVISLFFLNMVRLDDTQHLKTVGFRDFVKILRHDKIQIFYFLYSIIGNTSYCCALGMQMLILTNLLDYTVKDATFFFLVMGIVADIFGIVALKKLTPKNDYITIFLKLGFRMIGYTVAFCFPSHEFILLAIIIALFTSTAYENRTDGIYFNRLDTDYQLVASNVRNLVNKLGETVGFFLAGVLFPFGASSIFGVAALIGFVQLGIGWYLVHLRLQKTIY